MIHTVLRTLCNWLLAGLLLVLPSQVGELTGFDRSEASATVETLDMAPTACPPPMRACAVPPPRCIMPPRRCPLG